MNEKTTDILEYIKVQTGLELKLCEHFKGVHVHNGKRYINVELTSEAKAFSEYVKLDRIANKYSTIKRVEPNGLTRVAVFF